MPNWHVSSGSGTQKELESVTLGSGSSWVNCYDGTSPATVTDTTTGDRRVGAFIAASNKRCQTVYITFDLTSVPAGHTVVSGIFSFERGIGGGAWGTGRELLVYRYDFTIASFSTADWRTTAQVNALPLLGSRSMDTLPALGAQIDIPISGFADVGIGSQIGVLVTSSMHRDAEVRPGDPDYYIDLNIDTGGDPCYMDFDTIPPPGGWRLGSA